MQFIQLYENIVICGMGTDTRNMMWQLDWDINIEDFPNIIFYDKKIALQNQSYRGRKVIGMKDLVKYRDYYFVICSPKFKMEIFYDLIQRDIDPEHVFVFGEIYN